MYHVVLIMCCKLQLFVTKGGIRYSYFFIGYIRDKDGVRMEVGFGVERTLFSPGPNGHNYRHLCFSAVQTGKRVNHSCCSFKKRANYSSPSSIKSNESDALLSLF